MKHITPNEILPSLDDAHTRRTNEGREEFRRALLSSVQSDLQELSTWGQTLEGRACPLPATAAAQVRSPPCTQILAVATPANSNQLTLSAAMAPVGPTQVSDMFLAADLLLQTAARASTSAAKAMNAARPSASCEGGFSGPGQVMLLQQQIQVCIASEKQRIAASILEQLLAANRPACRALRSMLPPPQPATQVSPDAEGTTASTALLALSGFQMAPQQQPRASFPPHQATARRTDAIQTLKKLGSRVLRKADPYIDCSALVRDFSSTIHSLFSARRGRGGVMEPFPVKVAAMLEETKKEGLTDIVSFFSHGRAFAIFDIKRFISDVMPRFFPGQTKLSSFTRQLNLWGFLRISAPSSHPDLGGFYHPLFLEGYPELAQYMKRVGGPPTSLIPTSAAGGKQQQDSSGGVDPNFYAMSPLFKKRNTTAPPTLP